MTAQPLHNRIIVVPFPKKETTSNGLFIPETSQERPSKAKVVAVGNGTSKNPMCFKVDDIVAHIKNAGIPYIENGVEYFILNTTECHYRITNDN